MILNNQNMPKYIFTLKSENGDVVCLHAPQNWDSMSIDLNRDIDLGGVFEEFNVDSFTFTGSEEKRLLRDLWSTRGMLAKCSIRVSYLKASTRQYVRFSNDFVLDFQTYRKVTLSKSRNGIQLNTKVSGLVQKLKDRKATKVDLTKLVSVGGYNISDYSALKKTLNIPAIIVYSYSNFKNLDETTQVAITTGLTTKMTVPFAVISSDYTEAKSIPVAQGITVNDTRALFKDSLEDRSLDLLSGEIFLTSTDLIGFAGDLLFYYAKIDTDGSTLIDQTLINTVSVSGNNTYSFTFSQSVSLLADQSIIIWCEISSAIKAFNFTFGANEVTIRGEAISIDADTVETFPIYEAIERNLQLILDKQYPLSSSFFGRTDVIKNAAGDYYLSENQERFANLTNGVSLRGLVLSDENNSLVVSFTDLFKTINALWNVGMANEGEQIVIEERAYFFDDTVGTDLSDRINDLDIQYEALPDLVYAKIKSGYNNFEYEVINGRGEYNTQVERTSAMIGENQFDNVSPYRGDTRGIVLALQNKVSTEDLKSDKDIFIIKSQRNASVWDVEAEENIQVQNSTSIFGSDSMNLFFTPLRNLLRHAYEFVSGLDISSYIRFQTSDKLQNLQTTDGVNSYIENQDLQVNDLTAAKWKPGQFIITIPFYEEEIVSLISNKNKVVKLTDTKSGWILSAKYVIAKNKLELNILEKCT
jgi:hypothetical protein